MAFPASAASDRFGRRSIIAGGIGLGTIALVGLLLASAVPAIILFAATLVVRPAVAKRGHGGSSA